MAVSPGDILEIRMSLSGSLWTQVVRNSRTDERVAYDEDMGNQAQNYAYFHIEAGKEGAFSWLLAALTTEQGQPREIAYFWVTGALSAFLDNAPTYLVLFELTGGDARELMGPLAGTLAAISMGAVYMGAMTYIGNAPNFMVYAIAVERGVRMPSFFGYMIWSAVVLLPVMALLTFVVTAKPW